MHTHRVTLETWWHEALNKCSMEKNKSIFNTERNYYRSCILLHQEDLKHIITQEWISSFSWYRQGRMRGGGRWGEEGFRVTQRQGNGSFLSFGGWEQPGNHRCVWWQKTAARLSALSLHSLWPVLRKGSKAKRKRVNELYKLELLGYKYPCRRRKRKRERKRYTRTQIDTSGILYFIWWADPSISFTTSTGDRASNMNTVFHEPQNQT